MVMCDGKDRLISNQKQTRQQYGRGAGEDAPAGAFRSEVGESRVNLSRFSKWKRPGVEEMGGMFEIRGKIGMQCLPIVRAIIHGTANRGVL